MCQNYRRKFRYASFVFYRKLCTMPPSTVERNGLKCSWWRTRVIFFSSSVTQEKDSTSKQQSDAKVWVSRACKSGFGSPVERLPLNRRREVGQQSTFACRLSQRTVPNGPLCNSPRHLVAMLFGSLTWRKRRYLCSSCTRIRQPRKH